MYEIMIKNPYYSRPFFEKSDVAPPARWRPSLGGLVWKFDRQISCNEYNIDDKHTHFQRRTKEAQACVVLFW